MTRRSPSDFRPWQLVRVGSKVQDVQGTMTGRVLRIRRRRRGWKVPMNPLDSVTVCWESGSTGRTARSNLKLAE